MYKLYLRSARKSQITAPDVYEFWYLYNVMYIVHLIGHKSNIFAWRVHDIDEITSRKVVFVSACIDLICLVKVYVGIRGRGKHTIRYIYIYIYVCVCLTCTTRLQGRFIYI